MNEDNPRVVAAYVAGIAVGAVVTLWLVDGLLKLRRAKYAAAMARAQAIERELVYLEHVHQLAASNRKAAA